MVEAEEVVWVVAVLELHQALPVLRRVGGPHPLWRQVAGKEEVNISCAGLVLEAHLFCAIG